MIRLHVVGYYGHYNCGDEQYKQAFQILIDEYFPKTLEVDLSFIDCDKIHTAEFKDEDIIMIGGGDVFNDYFLDKIIATFATKKNKIIGVSVGLPFTSTLTDTNKLNVIDYIFIRTQQDVPLFHKYFHPHRVMYLPDLSYLHNYIENVPGHCREVPKSIIDAKENGQKVVCLSLSRHMHNKDHPEYYENVITNLGHFIKFLVNFKYHVVMLPMNTNENNPTENDNIINRDVLNWIMRNGGRGDRTFITIIEETLDVQDIFAIMKHVDICVPMRFHACLFAIYNHVPILPVYTTRKIKNLLLDISWNPSHAMELDVDKAGTPKGIDLNLLISRFVSLVESKTVVSTTHSLNSNVFSKVFNENVGALVDVTTNDYSKVNVQSLTSTFKSDNSSKIDKVFQSVQEFAFSKGYSSFTSVDDDALKNVIVCIVSYHLTNGCIESKYNYGLKEKMFNGSFNYREEWQWILSNESENHTRGGILYQNPHGLYNLGYIDQTDYSGAHRSGWQYVYENIKYLHNDKAPLLLDMYVDKTFHWGSEVNTLLKVIPYTKPWMGVIHHTFDTTFSTYNCVSLLQRPEFIESLKCCKGLIVLSGYLESTLTKELAAIGHSHIRVHTLTHPTEIPVNENKFTMAKFLSNSDPKLIHVGGWLRNVYTFYNLHTPQVSQTMFYYFKKRSFTLRKVALRGKYMSNYYPYPSLLSDMHLILKGKPKFEAPIQNASQNTSQNTSFGGLLQGSISNNWNRHFYEDMSNKLKNVDYLDYQDNNEYDALLTQNVVFLHLVDASAVNTVIECIVRETPIVVNKHPAIVEMLGANYPLYFTSTTPQSICQEVEKILSSTYRIRKANLHMKRLSKERYDISLFINQLTNIARNQ
jgi:hypothetical protein